MKRIKSYSLWVRLLCCVLLLIAISGCATLKTIEPEERSLKLNKKSLVLLKVVTRNEIAPLMEPYIFQIVVGSRNSGKTKTLAYNFQLADKGFSNSVHHLIPFYIEPGEYYIRKIRGMSGDILVQLVVSDEFWVQPLLSFDVEPNSVIYIGTLYLTYRDPNKMEGFPVNGGFNNLGSIFFKKGVFDMSITDEPIDILVFKNEFPVLNMHEIKIDLIKK